MVKLILICIFLISRLTWADDMQELLTNLHNTCVSETGADEALIADAQKGVFAEDDKLKCYMKCILDQMAVVSDDGIIDVEAAISLLPPDIAEISTPFLRKCDTIKGSSPCDNIFQTNKCYFKENPKAYFLP